MTQQEQADAPTRPTEFGDMGELVVIDLGRAEYQQTLELQKSLLERLHASRADRGFLLLVEHDPPVITLGQTADAANVVADAAQRQAAGVHLHPASRGGDVTYHGPGQLVGYPILRLDRRGRDIHRYLRDVEEVLIRLLGEWKLTGTRVDGRTGVWVGEEKIAAIGVAVSRSISYHGFALNVCCNLDHFGLIVPCGIADKGVTSLERCLGRPIAVEEVKQPLIRELAELFRFGPVRCLTSEQAHLL